jgi:hypothetical protein
MRMLAYAKQRIKNGHRQIPPTDLEIVTIRDIEGIESIRSVWEDMQCKEPFPVPNADINRYIAFDKSIGDGTLPHVILIKRGGNPAAMVIGRIESHRLNLRLGYKTLFGSTLRCLSVVYGGIIGQPSSELCAVIMDELMNVLRRGEADLVFLNHLRTDSPIYKLYKTTAKFWSRNHSVLAEPHWQTNIADTMKEFYSNVPRSRRRRWRRNIRQLEKISPSEIKVVCYSQLSDIAYLSDVADKIEEVTYKKNLGSGFISCPLNRDMLEQAARDGWLRAYVLYVGDQPCAFQFDVQYEGAQFTEYGSFDPKWSRGSPGIVLLIKVLEELCKESGISRMDFGFGDALYKRKFGTDHWMEESVYIYAPRLRPVLIKTAMSMNLVFSLLRRAVIRLNLDGWIKRNWRKAMLKNGGNGDR